MGTRRLGIAVVMAIVASLLAAAPAGSVVLYEIYGEVTDAVGRPLGGATVVDSRQGTTSAPDGTYSLPQEDTGRFTLRAWRHDTVSEIKVVDVLLPIDTQADFTLVYRISGSVSPSAISTASGPSEAIVSFHSRAPSPGEPGGSTGDSCVFAVDSRTGVTEPAVLVEELADGSSMWEQEIFFEESSEEGRYTMEFWAEDCGTGEVLSIEGEATYRVDNTPPFILPQSLTPPDRGNTVFADGQPLAAKIGDAQSGAGVEPDSIVFVLTNETTGEVSTHPAPFYNVSTWWAKTAPVPLVEGHVYTMEVEARDRAGNIVRIGHDPVEIGGGFLATTLDLESADAWIPETPCEVSDDVGLDGRREVTCPDVTLEVGSTTAVLGGTRHGGNRGYVDHTAPLDSAYLRTEVGGQEFRQNAYEPGTSESLSAYFEVPRPSSEPVTYSVEAVKGSLGTLTARVPAIWTDATLSMPSSPLSRTILEGQSCPDPTETGFRRAPHCTPDPAASRFLAVSTGSEADPQNWVKALTDKFEIHPTIDMGQHVWFFAPQDIVQGIFEAPLTATVVNAGDHHVVDGWGESVDGTCVSRTISSLHNPLVAGEAPVVGTTAEVSVQPDVLSDCGASLERIGVSNIPCPGGQVCDWEDLVDVDSCPTGGSRRMSSNHTLKDPPSISLGWLRSKHRGAWGGCQAWWREADGDNQVRAGAWLNHWNKDWPESIVVTWGQQSSGTTAAFKGDFWSEDSRWPDCDVEIVSTVLLDDGGNAVFLTDKHVESRGTGWSERVACNSVVIRSATEFDDGVSEYHGESTDKEIMLTPGGDEKL